MRPWTRGLYLVTGLAAILVAVSSVVAAVRQGSWGPVISVAWMPGAVAAVWPGTYRRRCLPRGHRQAG